MVAAAIAEPVRVATWHGDFSRKGPGLLLRDLTKTPPDLSPILSAAPDVLLLTDFDFDAGSAALGVLRDTLADQGQDYPYLFSIRPNTGMATDRDLDGDGRRGGPRDAQGFGWFPGQGGMAMLSRFPVSLTADQSGVLWKDVPDTAISPDDPGFDLQRLSSSGHWLLRVEAPDGALSVLTLSATPPVFDGPEDRNGRRNRDEVLFWIHVMEGRTGARPDRPVLLLGNLNLDPERCNGRRAAAQTVLKHPWLQDPLPGQPTVSWDSTGPMRVSYALPDSMLAVGKAGVTPPSPDLGPHGLVWVDLTLR